MAQELLRLEKLQLPSHGQMQYPGGFGATELGQLLQVPEHPPTSAQFVFICGHVQYGAVID